jgi:hypothetical protein
VLLGIDPIQIKIKLSVRTYYLFYWMYLVCVRPQGFLDVGTDFVRSILSSWMSFWHFGRTDPCCLLCFFIFFPFELATICSWADHSQTFVDRVVAFPTRQPIVDALRPVHRQFVVSAYAPMPWPGSYPHRLPRHHGLVRHDQ